MLMCLCYSGSMASRQGMEQQGEAGLPDASPSVGTAGRAAPDAAVRIAAAASAAAAAASAKLGTLLAGVVPPAPVSHQRGASSCAEARPAVPHFQAARCCPPSRACHSCWCPCLLGVHADMTCRGVLQRGEWHKTLHGSRVPFHLSMWQEGRVACNTSGCSSACP